MNHGSPFMVMIFKLLNYIEILAVAATGAAFAMIYVEMSGGLELLMISMSVLASVFFLRAYQPLTAPPPQPGKENDQAKGFLELFCLVICPKVLGIGSSVTTVGILFMILKLKGAMEMLLIGCTVLPLAMAPIALYALSKPAWFGTLMPLLYRAVPLWLVGVYMLMSPPAQ